MQQIKLPRRLLRPALHQGNVPFWVYAPEVFYAPGLFHVHLLSSLYVKAWYVLRAPIKAKLDGDHQAWYDLDNLIHQKERRYFAAKTFRPGSHHFERWLKYAQNTGQIP